MQNNNKLVIFRTNLKSDELNKIICIHNNTEILDKIYNLFDYDIFQHVDLQFSWKTDCLRYGDVYERKWLFNNVLPHNDQFGVDNILMNTNHLYLFFKTRTENIKILLDEIERLTKDEINNLDWIILRPTIKVFQKIKLLIDFIGKIAPVQ